MNILIAEAQEILREGLAATLRTSYGGANVLTAADGLTAIELAKKTPLDLVVLDIDLPPMPGIETAKRLLSSHSELRVVFLTMRSEKSLIHDAFQAGASGYVLKDEHPDVLHDAIGSVLKDKSFLSKDLRSKTDLSAAKKGDPETDGFQSLTKRQIQVLTYIASGLSIREIASKTGLSTKTLDAHRRRIAERLGVDSIAGFTRIAIREALVKMDGSFASDIDGVPKDVRDR